MLSLTFVMCLVLVFRSISSGDLEEGTVHSQQTLQTVASGEISGIPYLGNRAWDPTQILECDQCSFSDGSKGICKVVTDCPAVVESIQHGVLPETICGFVGLHGIVCCKGSSPTPAPTPKSPTAIPTDKPTPKPTLRPTPEPTPQLATTTPVKITNRSPGDISKQKCKEYAEYAYDRSESPSLLLDRIIKTLECVYEKLDPFPGGSTFASRHEFPHMALIGYSTSEGTEWACGGSLISENYILTAAHCLKNKLGPAKYVRLGIVNQTDTASLQERDVSGLISHPEYRGSSQYHDIGLLRLAKNLDLNPYVRPACLQTEKRIPYKRAIASGWGKIGFSGPGSYDLLKAILEFFDLPKCNITYKRYINGPDSSNIKDGIINDYTICAGAIKEFKDTCEGYPGGPLQIYHEDTPDIKCMYDIVGITSFAKSCGLSNVPGVYTRVFQYLKWIEDIVWP